MKSKSANQSKESKPPIPAAKSTNNLILSAYRENNDYVFAKILELYVPKGSTVADVTYGKGVFWRKVDREAYALKKSDLKTGTDCRRLRYKPNSLDCVVFDPPYMHTSDTAHQDHQNFEKYYANGRTQRKEKRNGRKKKEAKYHEAVLDLYFKAARQALRVLKEEGVYVVKCQDEVCSNKQRLTHVELINEFVKHGWIVEDLFVVIRAGSPGNSKMVTQVHARKNHSFFLVFRKPKAKKIKPKKAPVKDK